MGADSFTITLMHATAGGAGAASETAVEIAVTNLTLSFGTFVNVTKANQLSGAIIVDGNGVAAEPRRLPSARSSPGSRAASRSDRRPHRRRR